MPERATTLAVWIYGIGSDPRDLADCLRSVLVQRVAREVVCVLEPGHTMIVPEGVRVTVVDSDEGPALDDALARSDSDYVVWLDASSRATNGGLALLCAALDRFAPDAAYGDSSGPAGIVRRPINSPLRLRSRDYMGGLRAFSVAWLRAAGGFRTGVNGGHAYEVALRAAESTERILHVPEVLSTTAEGVEPPVHAEIVRAALGDRAEVSVSADGSRTIEYALAASPLVSVIIPTRGGSATIRGAERVLVVEAVRGVLEGSTYPHLELVIVADDATPQAVIDELLVIGGDRMRLLRWSAPFDFSAKINRGAAVARGEYLVVLNDDVELITPDWIEVMLGLAQQEGVGLVGTMLQFEDGTIQHGGHLYRDSNAGHIAFRWPIDRDDALGSLRVDREVSGVTAACAMVSAETFRAVGGFSTLFPGNYNDVDFCLKVRARGDSVIWTPRARLYHFESKTRVATIAPVEIERLRERWSERLLVDPFWP